jgi:hypothetical protein
MRGLIVVAMLLFFLTEAATPAERSAAARAAFKREQPCPSTGLRRGACPGWVIDHIQPLCAGGADRVSNMQWQTVADAKAKDRWERELCRRVQPVYDGHYTTPTS